MNTTTRIGIIGCGNISDAYFTGLGKFSCVEVVACADLDPARAEAKAAKFGVRAFTPEDLLTQADVELVINLTIPKAHAAVNRAILEAGKHAYCEKPFALEVSDGLAAIETARRMNLRLGSAPDTFLGGGLQTCRELIDSGAIGRPFAVSCSMGTHGPEHWHPDPEFVYAYGGGPMLDMGPYYLTALVNFLGPVRRASGAASASLAERTIGSGRKKGTAMKVEVPTHYAAVYEFVSGAIATATISFDIWHHHLPIFEIYGTEGSLSVPDPNSFGGEVLLRGAEDEAWRSVPLTRSDKVSRGIGVADMALAIRENRPHRANCDLACHVLEAMRAPEVAVKTGQFVVMETSCERPAILPSDGPLVPGD